MIDFRKLMDETPEQREASRKAREDEYERSNFRVNQRRIEKFNEMVVTDDLPDFERGFIRNITNALLYRYLDLTRPQQTVFDRICAERKVPFEHLSPEAYGLRPDQV